MFLKGTPWQYTFSSMHHSVPQTPGDTCAWLSASPPLRCLHMGQGTPLCFLGKKLPQGQGNRPSQRLLPHPSPTQEAYRPSGWAGPDGCGTSFLPHFYFSFWSFVLEGEALKNILFSGLRSQAKLDKSKTPVSRLSYYCVFAVYAYIIGILTHIKHCALLFHILLASLFQCHQNSSHINAHNITV